jgi:hypothetical protein
MNRWQEADLIDTDFRALQDDLTGGIACKSICAKMSQVLRLSGREFSLSMRETGNICHRAGCVLATPGPTATLLQGLDRSACLFRNSFLGNSL